MDKKERRPKTKPDLGLFLQNLQERHAPINELTYVIINQQSNTIRYAFNYKKGSQYASQQQFLKNSLMVIQNYLTENNLNPIPIFLNTSSSSHFLQHLANNEMKQFKLFTKNSVDLFDFVPFKLKYEQRKNLSPQSPFVLFQSPIEMKKVVNINDEIQYYVKLVLFYNKNKVFLYEEARRYGSSDNAAKLKKFQEIKLKQIEQILEQRHIIKFQNFSVKEKKDLIESSISSYEGGGDDEDQDYLKAIQQSLQESEQIKSLQNSQENKKKIPHTDEQMQMNQANNNNRNNFSVPQNIDISSFYNAQQQYFASQLGSYINQQKQQEILFKQGIQERRKKFDEFQKKQLEIFQQQEDTMEKQFMARQIQDLQLYQVNLQVQQKNSSDQVKQYQFMSNPFQN